MLTISYHFLWAKVTILSLLICIEGSNRNRITKRAIEDKFEVLLNLYKINPLRESKLYKQFSNRILLPNKVDIAPPVMHFDSNESVKERKERTNMHLKQIEDAIHVTRHQNNKSGPPAPSYSVQEIGEEKFSSSLIFKDVQRLKQFKMKKDGEIFDNIFEHIESYEIPDNEKKKGKVQERNTAKSSELRKIATELNIEKKKGIVQERITAKSSELRKIATELNIKKKKGIFQERITAKPSELRKTATDINIEKKKVIVQERITAKPNDLRKIATESNIKNVNLFKSNENLNKIILSTEEVVIMR